MKGPGYLKLAVLLGLVAGQSDCSSSSTPGPHFAQARATADACDAEQAAFRRSSAGWGGSAALSPSDYAQVLDTETKDYGSRLLKLRQDADALDRAIEESSDDYTALTDCRSRARRDVSVASDADVALARQDAAAFRQQEINLRQAVDRLFAENAGLKRQVWQALSAPPVPTQPLIAMASGLIHARPSDAAAKIAWVRKGDRIVAAEDPAPSGWAAITLNDGTTGYVESDILRPGKPNPSALAQASEARRVREAAADPVVALARATRESLPQHRASFADLVESRAAPAGVAEGAVRILSAVSPPSNSANAVE